MQINVVNKIEKIATNSVKIIFLTIIVFLFVCSVFGNATVNKKEHTDYFNDNFIIHIVSILTISIIAAYVRFKKIKVNKKIIIASVLLWIIVCVSWILMTQFQPRADQKYTMDAAMQMRENNFSCLKKGGYLYIHPHQYGLTLYFYFISFIFNEKTFLAVQFINILALLVAFYAIYKTMEQFHGSKEISKQTVLGLLIFAPIAMYVTFIYGNILGLACSSLAIMFEIMYLKNNKKRNILLMAIFATLAVIFKSNYLITMIAMLILLFSEMLFRKKIKYVIPIIAIILFYLLGTNGVKFSMKLISNVDSNDGTPNITYVAMGMQEGEMAPGWYNEYNKKVYVKNKYNSLVATEKAKQNITERMEMFKNNPKYAAKFFFDKTTSQWNNPTFQSIWVNQNRKAGVKKNRVVKSILKNKRWGQALVWYMNIIQTAILYGVFMYFILNYKNIKIKELIFSIIFIGGFIFHLIWEAKCQYTITYFILLIPYSVLGYKFIGDELIKLYNLKIKRVKFIA